MEGIFRLVEHVQPAISDRKVTAVERQVTGHLALRAWGLHVGWTRGLGVASALANPVLRQGPTHVARAAAATAGLAVPLAAARLLGHHVALLGAVLVFAAVGAVILVRLHGRVEGYKLALVLIALLALVSVAR